MSCYRAQSSADWAPPQRQSEPWSHGAWDNRSRHHCESGVKQGWTQTKRRWTPWNTTWDRWKWDNSADSTTANSWWSPNEDRGRASSSSSLAWQSHDRSNWKEQPQKTARLKCWLIGDSTVRGLQRLFKSTDPDNDWTIDANEGKEPLALRFDWSKIQEYDHVIYCSAGNAIWKQAWEAVVDNIRSLDPQKVSVILLGNSEIWCRLAKEQAPFMSFFEDAKQLLRERGVRVTELTSFMESLEYVDNEGHPTKDARWKLTAGLVEAFQDLRKTS
eukprot:TRINITY_DN34851_c0_g1_i1.p1 TRINITY_DN34851_c0_g1~~TRINITY_DN34851_c0_g1_i1.p1  ORF type:complete len:273 (+),score=41.10 TRINITY_DN34851_c0_g1_i1:116-934(+)